MAGAWLILSPFILSFESSFTICITVAAGVLIAVFSLVKGKIKKQYGGGWKSLFEKNPLHVKTEAEN
jgi:hypothetical protein